MYKCILYVLFALAINTIQSQNNFPVSPSSFKMTYFEDVNGSYSFKSIAQQPFTQTKKNYINLGITKSTLWIKLKLNIDSLDSKSILIVKTALKDTVTISYIIKNGERIKDSLGVMYPHSKNKLNHFLPAFEIPITDLSSPVIYLKIQSRYSMKVPISILSKEKFNNNRITEYLIGGLLIGGLFLMGIYNLFLYFSTRDFSYLLYVLALFSAILSQGYLFGILIPYLSPESPEFSFRFPVVIISLTGVFSSLFTIQFLELKKLSNTLYNLLLFLIICMFFNIALELLKIDYVSRKINITLIITTSIVIFYSTIYCLVKGKKTALYFTIAWTFYLLGIVIFALQSLGIIAYNTFTEHIMHVGTFLEVVLLSFALGHKYKLVRMEKDRLEKQTREELELLVKSQTLELESSLKEKEVLLQEVHHRVKNNLQIVISLLDLQAASIENTKNKETLIQSKTRVYSMSLIHQKLYQSGNLSHINIRNYIEDLFSYIQSSHRSINHEINFSSSIENKKISLTQAVPLGLIINELLTNSFKYGMQDHKVNSIQISLRFEGKDLKLLLSDSGPGFNEEKETHDIKKSFGLFLVKSLTKQLRGTISRYYSNNLFVTELIFSVKDMPNYVR